MGRENVTVLSYMDHFLAAAGRLFEVLLDREEREVAYELGEIWNIARKRISAGMGLQDLVKNLPTWSGK